MSVKIESVKLMSVNNKVPKNVYCLTAHVAPLGRFAFGIVKPVRRACARGSKFGQDVRAVRAKYRLAGLTTFGKTPRGPRSRCARQARQCLARKMLINFSADFYHLCVMASLILNWSLMVDCLKMTAYDVNL